MLQRMIDSSRAQWCVTAVISDIRIRRPVGFVAIARSDGPGCRQAARRSFLSTNLKSGQELDRLMEFIGQQGMWQARRAA
jgi:hypothetical protein